MALGPKFHAWYNGLLHPTPKASAQRLYDDVEAELAQCNLLRPEDRAGFIAALAADISDELTDQGCVAPLAVVEAYVRAVIDREGLFRLPAFDFAAEHSTATVWQVQEQCERQARLLQHFDAALDALHDALRDSLEAVLSGLPALPEQDDDALTIETTALDAAAQVSQRTERIIGLFASAPEEPFDLFPWHRSQVIRNLVDASGGNPNDPKAYDKTFKMPCKHGGSSAELVETYLAGLPIADLFRLPVSIPIPQQLRFEHHHIVAGSGHGKSQTLQYLIAQDLADVAEGKKSVVVIDSQGDLIKRISHLKEFAAGGALHDRLVLIDPTDIEWPVSLNLFDVGLHRLSQYPAYDRERLTNSILELYEFVLGSLLSAEMTQKQNVIFRYVARLMLVVPDATIHTLRDLMEPKSEVRFADSIDRLTGSARDFFRTEFGSSEFAQTRRQVLRRLWGILENQTFERMFSHPRSKLDLYAELNQGKVILINTAKDLLKEAGTEIFGRFFIALIAQAAQERATLPERNRMPTLVYIDEAADYFDRNIGLILSSARKYRVGMILAHQYLGQLDPKLLEAFSANTSIKFAGGVSARDAKALAAMMGCEPELIDAQDKGCFAASFRGLSKTAFPIRFPLGFMESLPSMSGKEFERLHDKMRQKYAVPIAEHGRPSAERAPSAAAPTEPSSPDKPTSKAAKGKDRSAGEDIDDAPKPWV